MLEVRCGESHYGPLSRRMMQEWEALKDLCPATEVDKWSPWDCYQGPLSPPANIINVTTRIILCGRNVAVWLRVCVISSKLIYLLRSRRNSYVTSMVICGTEGEC